MNMEIAIYVDNPKDLTAANALAASFTPNGEKSSLQIVNLMDSMDDGVPAEVIQAMLSKKADTFPLTSVGGQPVVYGRLPSTGDLEQLLHDAATAPGDFQGLSRLHISLDVNDFEKSLAFYKVFFNTEPVKMKGDYAQFILSDPPVNFVINYFGRKVDSKDAPTNHMGIQLKTKDGIATVIERYKKAGFQYIEENDTACCYAVQTKVWVADPDGNKWEVYISQAESDHGCGDDCICWDEIPPANA
jgi:catechol 2,3-dioxygenase-like lactoylglutathione lyase family enzyme